MAADGAAAVEVLRAELARAKEQARRSNAAAKKASAELKAEQAARRQDKEKISMVALELENATGRCEFLEKENKALTAELDKALQERGKRDRNPEQPVRRFGRPGRLRLESPFCCKLSSVTRTMLSLTKCGVLRTSSWTCRRVLPMRRSITKRGMGMQWRSFFGRSLAHQNALYCSMNRCPNGPNFIGYPALP